MRCLANTLRLTTHYGLPRAPTPTQAAYRAHPEVYQGEVRKLLDLDVAIPSSNIPRIAATLAAEKSHDLVRVLLEHMSIAETLAFTKVGSLRQHSRPFRATPRH